MRLCLRMEDPTLAKVCRSLALRQIVVCLWFQAKPCSAPRMNSAGLTGFVRRNARRVLCCDALASAVCAGGRCDVSTNHVHTGQTIPPSTFLTVSPENRLPGHALHVSRPRAQGGLRTACSV